MRESLQREVEENIHKVSYKQIVFFRMVFEDSVGSEKSSQTCLFLLWSGGRTDLNMQTSCPEKNMACVPEPEA